MLNVELYLHLISQASFFGQLHLYIFENNNKQLLYCPKILTIALKKKQNRNKRTIPNTFRLPSFGMIAPNCNLDVKITPSSLFIIYFCIHLSLGRKSILFFWKTPSWCSGTTTITAIASVKRLHNREKNTTITYCPLG